MSSGKQDQRELENLLKAENGEKAKAAHGKGKSKKQKNLKKPFAFRKLARPLVPLYSFGLKLREFRIQLGIESEQHLRWPVISIGNLSTGGTGKSPLAITLAKELSGRGWPVGRPFAWVRAKEPCATAGSTEWNSGRFRR